MAQLSHLVLHWQLVDPHIDILVQVHVVREDLLHDLACDRVKDRDHVRRLFCQPNSEIGLLRSQICEVDLKGLLVHSAHVLDAMLVSVNTLLLEIPEEKVEGLLDVVDDLLFLEP